MPVRYLPWWAALTATLAILSAPWALDNNLLNLVFKPLTTLLLIAWAWPRGQGDAARPWLRAGLCLSLLGDIALLWPVAGFLPGLVSFLLAHLAYSLAFTRGGVRLWWPAVAAYAAVALLVLLQLWPGIGPALRGPVLAYVLALAAMAVLAASRWQRLRADPAKAAQAVLARWAAVGGALFMLSDATLAFNKFAGGVPWSGLWILLSYWLAQGAIVASLATAPGRASGVKSATNS
jgi:uncharacterized membrane protein YhhN